MEITAADVIQKTHWPNIDLVGAQLDLYWAEFQVPVWRMQARSWKLWDALSERLEADGVLDEYDLVVLDTPPALGYLTINALAAADILLVPTGASFLEFEIHGPLLRHAARDLRLDRGGGEYRRPRAGPARGCPSNGTRCARWSPASTAASRRRFASADAGLPRADAFTLIVRISPH